MSGFQHDIAGGSGDLIATSVQSPNFVHGVSGWQIAKDGSAEFHDIIIPPGTGGATVTFAGTAPATPNVGDLWYNTSAGLEVSQWNGSAWTPYQIGTGAITPGSITAALIQANTITASQLAAGIVYAGIVNSTTINAATFTGSVFEGTDFILNTSGFFLYSGAPALGNLAISIVPGMSTVTDPKGNTAQVGITSYDSSTDYLQITADFINLVKAGLFQGQQILATGNAITQLSSGLQSGTDVSANVLCESQDANGTYSQVTLSAVSTEITGNLDVSGNGTTIIGSDSAVIVDGANNRVALCTGTLTSAGNNSVSLPASGGPFIPGESFHNITSAGSMTGNLSGSVALRVKLLPWNAVWVEWDFNITSTGTSFTFGSSFPSSAYYPVVSRHFPSSSNGAPQGRIFIGTSGAPQFLCTSGVANVNYGGSAMFATN